MKDLGEMLAFVIGLAVFIAFIGAIGPNGCTVTVNDQVYRLKLGTGE